jgi:hypothetical protein
LIKRILILAVLALAIWVGVDLFGPAHSNLREFDPNAIGHLEMEMWRSYYPRIE